MQIPSHHGALTALRRRRSVRWSGGAMVSALAVAGVLAPGAHAQRPRPLAWRHCGNAPHTQCASLRAPLDYDASHGRRISLFVARLPATDRAHRLGTIFVNFGGPGDTAADLIESFTAHSLPAVNDRYDIIAMDPRGVGQSRPAISCGGASGAAWTLAPLGAVDVGALLATDRAYVRRCVAANPRILAHVSTANVARDMDLLRRTLRERRIAYFGQSYGTLLGATYARLFPRHSGPMVLDGPLDPEKWLNHPLRMSIGAPQEDALRRFLASCPACGFGGAHPAAAYEALLDSLAQHPVPAHGPDPRAVGRVEALTATEAGLGHKARWPVLARALTARACARSPTTPTAGTRPAAACRSATASWRSTRASSATRAVSPRTSRSRGGPGRRRPTSATTSSGSCTRCGRSTTTTPTAARSGCAMARRCRSSSRPPTTRSPPTPTPPA
jgi:pimeloyl-ACP methyl ester carboxylesterase